MRMDMRVVARILVILFIHLKGWEEREEARRGQWREEWRQVLS